MHLFVVKRELISYIFIVKSIVLINLVLIVNYGLAKGKNEMKDKKRIIFLIYARIDLLIRKLDNHEELLIDDFIWYCIADYLKDKEENNA